MWEYLVENTDPRYVCFEMDVYWCTKGGKDPVAYLKKYPKRIEMLHIKDEFVIGESGTINFEAIFNQFYKNGMKNYVVEIETPKALREKTNADGSKYTKEQIMNEMFVAAQKSAAYLTNAKFVK
jgi:sugar phosphate isomerase/epimerase